MLRRQSCLEDVRLTQGAGVGTISAVRDPRGSNIWADKGNVRNTNTLEDILEYGFVSIS